MTSNENCPVCPAPIIITVHSYENDCNSSSVPMPWFRSNGTAVHFNFPKYYFLGTFFLFVSVALTISFCSVLFGILRRKRTKEAEQAITEVEPKITMDDGTTIPFMDSAAPFASMESLFKTESDGEYLSNPTVSNKKETV